VLPNADDSKMIRTLATGECAPEESAGDAVAASPELSMNELVVVFAYCSYIIGGVETLFVRLANELSSRGVSVGVFDHEAGYISTHADGRVCRINRLDGSSRIGPHTVVITPLATAELLRGLPATTRILLWSVHPDNVYGLLPRHRFAASFPPYIQRLLHPVGFKRALRVVSDLHTVGGLIFMDGPNIRAVERFANRTFPGSDVCPVPGPTPTGVSVTAPSGPLRIVWASRISVDKIWALVRFIDDLECAHRKKVALELVIIGSGEKRALLDNRLAKVSFPVRVLDAVPHHELEGRLREHHVFAGMGTALLEAAACGLPAIVVDPHPEMIRAGRKYRMLHQLEPYSLGEVISKDSPDFEGLELTDLLRSFSEFGVWDRCSAASVRRASDQHVPATADRLLALAAKTSATPSTISPVLKSYRIWRRLGNMKRLLVGWMKA
jgi:glycosyltransferase involved in cell wall biosynthesis